MIRCIAVDDEPLALEVIKKFSSESPLLSLVACFTDAIQAITFLRTRQIDLIFLDIQMPDISGIRFFETLKERPLVIFTTAYSEYAVKGFELEAVDYLMKPVRFDRFMKAVNKAVKILEGTGPAELHPDEFFFIKSDYKSVKIVFNEILYIEGLDDYIKIHLRSESRPVVSLMSLKGILEKLPPNRFMRVHRSYIVPISLIRSVHNRHISLGNVSIPVGDTYVSAIQDWLKKY